VARRVKIHRGFVKVRQAIFTWLIFVTQLATKSARYTDSQSD